MEISFWKVVFFCAVLGVLFGFSVTNQVTVTGQLQTICGTVVGFVLMGVFVWAFLIKPSTSFQDIDRRKKY